MWPGVAVATPWATRPHGACELGFSSVLTVAEIIALGAYAEIGTRIAKMSQNMPKRRLEVCSNVGRM